MPKGTIQFTVDDKQYWENYARAKGLKTASALARVAMYQYEARHPLKDSVQYRPGATEGKE